MAQKKPTFWLADGHSTVALVEGVEQRDRWVPLGWSEVDGPAETDQVWMRHEGHGGRARFPAGVVELWKSKGWQPSDPPPPVSPFNAPRPADVVEAAPEPAQTPAGRASGSKSEEK